MKLLKHINWNYNHFCIGVMTMLTGLYIMHHHDYLDSPFSTYPPIRGTEYIATSFADDAWFAMLFVVASILLLAGSMLNIKKLRNGGLYVSAGLYTAVSCAFFIRGVIDNHFNLTWLASALVVLLIFGVAKGGVGHLN